jgi:outer membrane protein, heavy metal efflux system
MILLNLLLGILAPAIAMAEHLTIDEAVRIALAKSPDIAQLEEQRDSSAAKARQVFAPSDPQFSITYNDMTAPFRIQGPASTAYQITQPIAFPGKAFVNHTVQSNQTENLSAQTDAMRLQVTTNVKAAYYQLAQARENLKLNREQESFLEQALAIAKRRYEANAITQVDILNAEVALYSSKNDRRDAESAEWAAHNQLNILLHNTQDAKVEVDAPAIRKTIPIDLRELEQKMLHDRNELKAARYQADASQASYRLAWMSLLPDLQLVAGTTQYNVKSASPYSGTPSATASGAWPTRTYMAGIQLTLPLWFAFNEREAITAASHDRAAAEASLDSVEHQSRQSLAVTVDSLQALRDKIANYEQHLLPLADQSMRLALTNYSLGKIDFQALSDTVNTRRNTRRDYTNAVVTFLTTYSSLGQLIGESL